MIPVYILVIFLTLTLRLDHVEPSTPCNQQTEVCVAANQSLTFPVPTNTPTEVTVQSNADFGSLDGYLKGIVAGFFDFVFPSGLPWGDVGNALQNFAGNNPNSTEGKGDPAYLGKEFGSIAPTMVVLVLIGIPGLLFLVFFPIVCCCICCCRCRNKCGGKREQNNPSNCCFIALLIGTSFTVTFILIGGALLCATHVQFTKDVPTQPFEMTNNSASTATTWIKNVLDDMFDVAGKNFNGTIDIEIDDLNTAGVQIWGLGVQIDIEDGLDTTTADLDTAITGYKTDAGSRDTYVANTFYGQSTESQNMKEISDSLQAIVTSLTADVSCTAACATAKDEIVKHVIGTPFTPTASYTEPPITDGFNQSTLYADIKARGGDAVHTLIQPQILDLANTMDQERDDLLASLSDTRSGLVDSIDSSGLNDLDLERLNKEANTYSWARDILSVMMFFPTVLVFVLAVIGIVFGLMGFDKYAEPHERSKISNVGGNLVCCSSVLSFLFVWSYMFWFIVPFLLLAFPQRICEDVQSGEITRELLDREYMIDGKNKYYFAETVLGDGNIELTLNGILNDCNNGKTFWAAFKMSQSSKYDISSNMNSDAIISDTSTLFSGSNGFDFSIFKLLDGDFETDVTDIKDNVATYQTAVDTYKTTMADNVDVYNTQLTTTQASTPTALSDTPCDSAGSCKSLADIKTDLSSSGVTSGPVTQALTDLDTAIANVVQMKSDYDAFVVAADASKTSLGDVSTKATALETAAASKQTDLDTNNKGSDLIQNGSDLYAQKLKNWLDEMFDSITLAYDEQVGECKTFALLYEAFFANTCDYFLLEVSGLYFSCAIIAVSMFGNLIWATKLAKYLRKMEDPYGKEEDDEIFEAESDRLESAESKRDFESPPPFAEGFAAATIAAATATGPAWSVKKSWEP